MQICDSLVYFLVFDTCRKTKTITTTKVQVDVKVHVYRLLYVRNCLEYLFCLFKFDTVYRNFPGTVMTDCPRKTKMSKELHFCC